MSRLRTIDDKVDENQDRNEILAGRHLTPLKRRGSDSSNGKTDRNSISQGIKTSARALMLGALLMGAAGCATGGYAQAQQQNVPSQQYEEIDYENMNLLKSTRAIGGVNIKGNKAVFGANIGKNTPNLEIFISDKDGNNQKRVTYTTKDQEISPIWTEDGRISFIYGGPEKCDFIIINPKEGVQISKPSYAIMDADGSNRQDITFSLYDALKNQK